MLSEAQIRIVARIINPIAFEGDWAAKAEGYLAERLKEAQSRVQDISIERARAVVKFLREEEFFRAISV